MACLGLALLALAGPLVLAVGPAAPASGFGLSLSAVPASGAAPLLVAFNASLSPANSAAAFTWAFGDGTFYEENAIAASTPTHAYAVAGMYDATVWANSSVGSRTASIVVAVSATAFTTTVIAAPSSGPAPLTVHFKAEVSGGTGTFVALVWNFGDGANGSGDDLEYTYSAPGTFLASVNVTDSVGDVASASQTITVTPAAATAPADSPPPTGEILVALALVLTAVALALGLARVWEVRSARSRGTMEVGPSAGPDPRPTEVATVVAPEELQGPSPTDGSVEASRRLSERLLVHLYWYGRRTADGLARAEATQQGMAGRLQVGQNSLSKSLTRLREAGLVTVSLEHVPGAPRRLKTYSLTSRGEALARQVRRDWKGG